LLDLSCTDKPHLDKTFKNAILVPESVNLVKREYGTTVFPFFILIAPAVYQNVMLNVNLRE